MAVLTNVGLNLWATAIQTNGAQVAVAYVSIGMGAGTLTSALTNGNTYTSLAITAAFTGTIANGQSLTLLDSVGDTQVITCNAATACVTGVAATIPVTSFMANANYVIGSGVVNTPSVADTALQNESARVVAVPGAAGAAFGESLNPGYFAPTTTAGTYLEVGYYGGSTATASLGTGTLIARDAQYWAHVFNADSAFLQLDSIL